jgi:hypothetical protein
LISHKLILQPSSLILPQRASALSNPLYIPFNESFLEHLPNLNPIVDITSTSHPTPTSRTIRRGVLDIDPLRYCSLEHHRYSRIKTSLAADIRLSTTSNSIPLLRYVCLFLAIGFFSPLVFLPRTRRSIRVSFHISIACHNSTARLFHHITQPDSLSAFHSWGKIFEAQAFIALITPLLRFCTSTFIFLEPAFTFTLVNNPTSVEDICYI